ncbi:hypothetical protein SBADM41S_01067 [Streptomyces badius]
MPPPITPAAIATAASSATGRFALRLPVAGAYAGGGGYPPVALSYAVP